MKFNDYQLKAQEINKIINSTETKDNTSDNYDNYEEVEDEDDDENDGEFIDDNKLIEFDQYDFENLFIGEYLPKFIYECENSSSLTQSLLLTWIIRSILIKVTNINIFIYVY